MITPKQRAIIEIARRTPARFVEIERTTRFTSHRNTMKTLAAENEARWNKFFEDEFWRRWKSFHGKEWKRRLQDA